MSTTNYLTVLAFLSAHLIIARGQTVNDHFHSLAVLEHMPEIWGLDDSLVKSAPPISPITPTPTQATFIFVDGNHPLDLPAYHLSSTTTFSSSSSQSTCWAESSANNLLPSDLYRCQDSLFGGLTATPPPAAALAAYHIPRQINTPAPAPIVTRSKESSSIHRLETPLESDELIISALLRLCPNLGCTTPSTTVANSSTAHLSALQVAAPATSPTISSASYPATMIGTALEQQTSSIPVSGTLVTITQYPTPPPPVAIQTIVVNGSTSIWTYTPIPPAAPTTTRSISSVFVIDPASTSSTFVPTFTTLTSGSKKRILNPWLFFSNLARDVKAARGPVVVEIGELIDSSDIPPECPRKRAVDMQTIYSTIRFTSTQSPTSIPSTSPTSAGGIRTVYITSWFTSMQLPSPSPPTVQPSNVPPPRPMPQPISTISSNTSPYPTQSPPSTKTSSTALMYDTSSHSSISRSGSTTPAVLLDNTWPWPTEILPPSKTTSKSMNLTSGSSVAPISHTVFATTTTTPSISQSSKATETMANGEGDMVVPGLVLVWILVLSAVGLGL